MSKMKHQHRRRGGRRVGGGSGRTPHRGAPVSLRSRGRTHALNLVFGRTVVEVDDTETERERVLGAAPRCRARVVGGVVRPVRAR